MGRRGRRRAQYDSDDSYVDYDSSSSQELVDSVYEVPWDIKVDEVYNYLTEYNRYYEHIDYRFKWMQVYVIMNILVNMFTIDREKIHRVPIINDDLLRNYSQEIYKILDLENTPLCYENENLDYVPIQSNEKENCINYITYNLSAYMNNYFTNTHKQEPTPPPITKV